MRIHFSVAAVLALWAAWAAWHCQHLQICPDEHSIDVLNRQMRFEQMARDVSLENLTNHLNCNPYQGTPYRRKVAVMGPNGEGQIKLDSGGFFWVRDFSHPLSECQGEHLGEVAMPRIDARQELLALSHHQQLYRSYWRGLLKLEALRPDLVVLASSVGGPDQDLDRLTECRRWLAERQEVLQRNLAYAETPGFLRESVAHEPGCGGHYRTLSSTHLAQGALIKDEKPYHLAFEDYNGRHFFAIQAPGGIEFTRNGEFHSSTSGHLVTDDGCFVLGRRGPIKVFGKTLEVNRQGQIRVDGKAVDFLLVCECEGPAQLKRKKDRRFGGHRECRFRGDLRVAPIGDYALHQGTLECSNVDRISQQKDLEEATSLLDSFDAISRTWLVGPG